MEEYRFKRSSVRRGWSCNLGQLHHKEEEVLSAGSNLRIPLREEQEECKTVGVELSRRRRKDAP